MTGEEMVATLVGLGVPAFVPGSLAADLAEGLGLPWIRKNGETWDRTNLGVDLARRIRVEEILAKRREEA